MLLLWKTICCLFITSIVHVAGFTSSYLLQKAPRAQPLFQQQIKEKQSIFREKDINIVVEGKSEASDSTGSTTGKFLSEKQIGIFVLATVSPYEKYGAVFNAKH
jgi:hypothetical protein